MCMLISKPLRLYQNILQEPTTYKFVMEKVGAKVCNKKKDSYVIWDWDI